MSAKDAQYVWPAFPFPTEGDMACISGVENIVVALGHRVAIARGESTSELAISVSPLVSDFKLQYSTLASASDEYEYTHTLICHE